MKLKKIDNKIIMYIPNQKINNNEDARNFLIKIFGMIKEKYNIDIDNYYFVNIYQNNIYGIIVELIEDDDVIIFKFDSNEINMKLNICYDKLFLYEIEDPLLYLENEVYYYDNKYYLNIKNKDLSIFENSKVIYDDTVYKILGRGIKL